MVFEKSQEIIFKVAEIWLNADITKNLSSYYKNVEEIKRKAIQDQVDSLERHKKYLEKEMERTKKHMKDKEKKQSKSKKEWKNELETFKRKIKEKENEIKDKSKDFKRLPNIVKDIKANLESSLKDFSKFLQDFLKIKALDVRSRDVTKELETYDQYIEFLKKIDDMIPIREIVNSVGVEFKLECEFGGVKVNDIDILLSVVSESVGSIILNFALPEKLSGKKVELLQKSAHYYKEARDHCLGENFHVKYYEGLAKYVNAQFVIMLGVKAVENYEYYDATKYFIQAREWFAEVRSEVKDKKFVDQQIALARAYASDAYNLIYLLNSYKNWKTVAENSDGELKEIADISIKKIEEWVEGQFGFPPENQIPQILKRIRWPRAAIPDELSDM